MYGKSYAHLKIYSPWVAVIPSSTTNLQFDIFLNMKFNTAGSGRKVTHTIIFSSTLSIHESDWLKNWYVSDITYSTADYQRNLNTAEYQQYDYVDKSKEIILADFPEYSAMRFYSGGSLHSILLNSEEHIFIKSSYLPFHNFQFLGLVIPTRSLMTFTEWH